MRSNLIERLERNSMPEPNSGCWLWLGAVLKDTGRRGHGYGRIRVGGRDSLAHRASWIAFNGYIPSGKIVCHKCDNPGCVNPDHLFLGTHQDNIDDMIAKGRYRPPNWEKRRAR